MEVLQDTLRYFKKNKSMKGFFALVKKYKKTVHGRRPQCNSRQCKSRPRASMCLVKLRLSFRRGVSGLLEFQ